MTLNISKADWGEVRNGRQYGKETDLQVVGGHIQS